MRRKNIVHKIILKMECFFSNLNKDVLSLLFNRYLVYNDYVSLLLLNKETYKYLKSTESRINQKVALRYWRWKTYSSSFFILLKSFSAAENSEPSIRGIYFNKLT